MYAIRLRIAVKQHRSEGLFIRSLVIPGIKFVVKNKLTDTLVFSDDFVPYSLLTRVFKACYILNA